jgi:hypothetical protein
MKAEYFDFKTFKDYNQVEGIFIDYDKLKEKIL